MLLRHVRRLATPAAAAVGCSCAASVAAAYCEGSPRFQDLPPESEAQRFRPTAPYGAWDRNWDYCEPTVAQVADALKHEYPIASFSKAIHRLYAEHTSRSPEQVERLLDDATRRGVPLEDVYKRAYVEHAYGGGTVRHILLVRHGQYEEHRSFARPLEKERDFGMMPLDDSWKLVDDKQVLTALGRRQAQATGAKLAQVLTPALHGAGREGDVRLHVSTMARARETAEIISEALPAGRVRHYPPDANLAEGWPLAHRVPYPHGAPQEEARVVHVEGARIEAAFRGLFYRGKPPTPPPESATTADAVFAGAADGAVGSEAVVAGSGHGVREGKRHEYDIVVCHGNVIRYFALRALQLPPEAWLRLCTFNCSITHIVIWPHGTVSLNSIGDVGHLHLDETTFSMHQGYEW